MRVTAISNSVPRWDRVGADFRFAQVLKGLARYADVSLLVLHPEDARREVGPGDFDTYADALSKQGVKVLLGGVRPTLRAVRPDVVWIEYYFNVCKALEDVRRTCPNARVIVDSVDIHFRRLQAKAELSGRDVDWAKADAVRKVELDAYRRSDLVVAVSDEDGKAVRDELGRVTIRVIPNVHPVPRAVDEGRRESEVLLFIGSYLHDPNVDGVTFFVREIWPTIRRAFAKCRVQLVGYAPPESVMALAGNGVEVVGYVPDTQPYLERATVSIAPLRYGAGLKGKVGEAMSYGLPVVTTSVGAEGLGATPGSDILVADQPAEFAEAVIQLLSDRQLREVLGQRGRQLIKRRYSEDAVAERLRALLAELPDITVQRPAAYRRVGAWLDDWIEQNVRWRLRGTHKGAGKSGSAAEPGG